MIRCRECGFDLAGLPDQPDRCPECGTFYEHPAAWSPPLPPPLWRVFLQGCWPALATLLLLTLIAEMWSITRLWWIALSGVGLAASLVTSRALSLRLGTLVPRREQRERELLIRVAIAGANVLLILASSWFFF